MNMSNLVAIIQHIYCYHPPLYIIISSYHIGTYVSFYTHSLQMLVKRGRNYSVTRYDGYIYMFVGTLYTRLSILLFPTGVHLQRTCTSMVSSTTQQAYDHQIFNRNIQTIKGLPILYQAIYLHDSLMFLISNP